MSARDINRKLARLREKLNDHRTVEAVLTAALLPAQNRTKEKAPYQSGTLRRSYHTAPTGQGKVGLGTDVEYAPFQEFGTKFMAARPHLRPAVDETKDRAMPREAAKALEAIVRRETT